MKRLIFLVSAVLLVSAAICVFSLWKTKEVLGEARGLTTDIFVKMERGDVTAAREGLVELATLWQEKEGLLEVLCDHEDLHNVKQNIIQARICMEYTDMEDFYSAMSLIGEGIEHILDEEAVSWTNLL